MAQQHGYGTNGEEFTEGPFVVVEAGGYRLEAELKGHICSVLPDSSIYEFLRAYGMDIPKHWKFDVIAAQVDFLNQKVKEGVITLRDGKWWGAEPVFHDGDSFER